MPDVSHIPIEELAKEPAIIRFHSLNEDGALSILIHRSSAGSSELLSITFRTLKSYRVTRVERAREESGRRKFEKKSDIHWFRTVGCKHLILTEDRLFEITSSSKPQCSIVAVKHTSSWMPTVPSRSTTWSDLLKHLESVVGTDERAS